MPEARKSLTIRRAIETRAGGRCEYCRSPAFCSPSAFQVEHIEPTAGGGVDAETNLAWSCGGCNGHKATAITAIDPETDTVVNLFHPRQDRWSEHFLWSEDHLEIVGRTPTGRATITRLHLNRPEVVALRRLLKLVGQQPPPESIE
jgi:5-methylcytosine-specific restriction endonuclease McrA